MKFDVIVVDPPWWFANRKTGGERKNKTKFGGGAQKHYDLMKAHEIASLPVQDIAADDCTLFLWCCMPLFYDTKRRRDKWKPTDSFKAPHDVLTVLQGWGFDYSTNAFTWVKMKKDGSAPIYGPGGGTASNVEICIMARRGKPLKLQQKMVPSVIMQPRMAHSQKPEAIQDRIDLMYPAPLYTRCELFARRNLSKWACIGNEVTGNDIREDINWLFNKEPGTYV